MIENQYIILEKQSIIQIINLNKTQLAESEIMQRLSLLSQHNPLAIGVSDCYEGLETVNIHYRQALAAARKILKEKSKRIGKFDRMLPELMLDRIFQSEDPRFYLTHHIRNLLDYDRSKGTELMKTLQVYLQANKSATRAQKILHISRATCLYRVRRIEEISGLNLDQPDTCLYLEILFMKEKYADASDKI